MQIIKTHYKNLSLESDGEYEVGKSPFTEQKSWQNKKKQKKRLREAKQNGNKNYGGPIPWVIFTKKGEGKTNIFKAPR